LPYYLIEYILLLFSHKEHIFHNVFQLRHKQNAKLHFFHRFALLFSKIMVISHFFITFAMFLQAQSNNTYYLTHKTYHYEN